MRINNKLYDTLKYLAQVGLPALATLVFGLGAIWNLGYADETAKTIVAFNVFLGALLLLNQVSYNRSDAKYDGTIDPYLANALTPDETLSIPAMDELIQVNGDPRVHQKEVLLKVEQPDLE